MNLKSERLYTIASCVRRGSVFADVGTDHAYIPAYLIESGLSPKGFAGDINKGPLDKAKKNLTQTGTQKDIELILCSGLVNFPLNIIDDIIIAGMGGDTIINILSVEKRISSRHRLILQPMTNVPKLRKYLFENKYRIIYEKLAVEDDKIYNIIVAEKTTEAMQATLKELYFGVNIEQSGDVLNYINNLKTKYGFHLKGLKSATAQNESAIKLAEAVIDMLEAYDDKNI